MSVPVVVASVVEAWVAAGRPPQPGIPWPRLAWLEAFPEHEALWRRLPDRLDRASVRAEALNAHASHDTALRAFLTTMAWGYGNVGYARHRVQRVLQNLEAVDRLRTAVEVLHQRGGLAAYERLADPRGSRLRGLGPAFGTKFLAFATADRPAPILDEMVSTWLARNLNLHIVHNRWHPPSYQQYLSLTQSWAKELALSPEDVEFCIFRSEVVTRPGNQWAL